MHGKIIILGIGGGIAAYKIADLASKLTQSGASVHAVLTESAQKFIAPLTFQALTHNPALTSLWSDPNNSQTGQMAGMPHIALADSADLILVAPATADLIAHLAHGFANDLLGTLVLATQAPIWVAPAMNPQMLAHPTTQKNLQLLREIGYGIIEPASGHMACEHIGTGRLPETAVLLAQIAEILQEPKRDLEGKKVVVTAGPTRENLDPVRYLSNRSSGKMGYAIAQEAARRGAHVTLVSGPVALPCPPNVERIEVITALEMRAATLQAFQDADYLVAAAAPADFRAASLQNQKIKRGTKKTLTLQLAANPDIVREAAQTKKAAQIVVGFAAETQNLLQEADRKLQQKKLDAIAANDITQNGAGFDGDTNQITWITKEFRESWPMLTKMETAKKLWDATLELNSS